MPKFQLNKLVRDGYPDIYKNDNQNADIETLSISDLKAALLKKIVEESNEISDATEKADIISELADIQQAIDDFMEVSEIDKADVEVKRLVKYRKLGGFTAGKFVKTLDISEDDEWAEYYRKRPDLFPEK